MVGLEFTPKQRLKFRGSHSRLWLPLSEFMPICGRIISNNGNLHWAKRSNTIAFTKWQRSCGADNYEVYDKNSSVRTRSFPVLIFITYVQKRTSVRGKSSLNNDKHSWPSFHLHTRLLMVYAEKLNAFSNCFSLSSNILGFFDSSK